MLQGLTDLDVDIDMTPEDKAYYSDGNYPLFELMSQEHGLTLTEGQLFDVINCVRMMDESHTQEPVFDIDKLTEQMGRIKDFEAKWLRASQSATQYQISAHHIVKMIRAEYDPYQIIEVIAKLCDDVFEKLHKKIELEPPAPIYIDPKSYTDEQLEQLLSIKKQKA